MTRRVAKYTMTREEFMRAVKRATRSKRLLAQAEKQEWFPIEDFYDAEADCGCVVGEYLMASHGERSSDVAWPDYNTLYDRQGVAIDLAVREALGEPMETEGLIRIVDGDPA